ncbi:MAG: hypothetical protein H6505_03305 [Calditrichaeota bacterium]|nr:hypothetical protein [Calditrichota bacterium]
MAYVFLVCLGMLWIGCDDGCGPYTPKPRESDLIGIGVHELADGNLRFLAQEVNRWQEADPVALDCSIPPDFPYYLRSQKLTLAEGGRVISRSSGSEFESSTAQCLSESPDGYLVAGLLQVYCDNFSNYIAASVPLISVYSEDHQLMRYAQLPCEYGFLEMDVLSRETEYFRVQVVELSNGDLLYWGLAAVGGHVQAVRVSPYGEPLWSKTFDASRYASGLAALPNGEFAEVNHGMQQLVWFDASGNATFSHSFPLSGSTAVQTAAALNDSLVIVAGVTWDTQNPYVWTVSRASQSVVAQSEIELAGCQDSTAVFNTGDGILLVCRNGEYCGGPGSQTAVLLDYDFNLQAQENFGGSAHVVLRSVRGAADGGLYLCGATEINDGTYRGLLYKYSQTLAAEWNTYIAP